MRFVANVEGASECMSSKNQHGVSRGDQEDTAVNTITFRGVVHHESRVNEVPYDNTVLYHDWSRDEDPLLVRG